MATAWDDEVQYGDASRQDRGTEVPSTHSALSPHLSHPHPIMPHLIPFPGADPGGGGGGGGVNRVTSHPPFRPLNLKFTK